MLPEYRRAPLAINSGASSRFARGNFVALTCTAVCHQNDRSRIGLIKVSICRNPHRLSVCARRWCSTLSVRRARESADYPIRPITIVVPYPAGGPTDLVGRVIADGMKRTLGQPVIVENVPGASGTVGSSRVLRAAPDGYTLLVGQWSSHVGAGATLSLTYDPVNDFEPVALLTSSPLWIVSHKNLPVDDLKGLVTWLRANPGKATAGTVEIGSGTHMCLLYFQNMTDTRFQVVPYRGGPAMMQDCSPDNRLHLPGGIAESGQYRSGAIKVFGVMSNKRWFAVPEVPTSKRAEQRA